MAKQSVDDILEAIKELSIIEAAELSKKIEEEFGIQAAAPMAVGVAAGPGGAGPRLLRRSRSRRSSTSFSKPRATRRSR